MTQVQSSTNNVTSIVGFICGAQKRTAALVNEADKQSYFIQDL